MAARMVMKFAVTKPSAVERLVVVDMGARALPPVLVNRLLPWQINAMEHILSLLSPDMSFEQALQVADQYLRAQPNLKVLRRNLLLLADPHYLDNERSNVDALFVAADGSAYLTVDDFEDMKQTFPNARLVIVKDAKHWVHDDKTEEFVELMPNIVGVVRFSYGFHRTSSPRTGLVLDTLLGVESVVNVVSDVLVILLLWKTEKPFDQTPYIGASPHGLLATFHNWLKLRMAGILGIFVAWNTMAMMMCCGANLIGLRYPPKWLSIIAGWAPVIISAAFVKLYYNTLLYDFYKKYDASQGRAFDVHAPLQESATERKRGRWWPGPLLDKTCPYT
ncbi:hypothetical protein MTO96_009228 [Rhipicephalus appendiculatus]